MKAISFAAIVYAWFMIIVLALVANESYIAAISQFVLMFIILNTINKINNDHIRRITDLDYMYSI